MQQRHKDRRLYFNELANTSREFYIDYIEEWCPVGAGTKVLEIGCGAPFKVLKFMLEESINKESSSMMWMVKHHIDSAMRIHIHITGAGELFRHARADHLRAVQTQNRIHDGGVVIIGNQIFRHGPRLGKAGLLGGNVDIIIHVAATDGEMPLGHTQK